MILKNETTTNLRKINKLILAAIIGGQFFNIGCASIAQRDNSISSILIKENELIKKIKVERSEPELLKVLSKDPILQKAENHLILGLEEIQNSNEKIINAIINLKQKEIVHGKN